MEQILDCCRHCLAESKKYNNSNYSESDFSATTECSRLKI